MRGPSNYFGRRKQPPHLSIDERIEGKITRTEDGHWVWNGNYNKINKNPLVSAGDGCNTNYVVHRYLYEKNVKKLFSTPLVKKCSTERCVNPQHFEEKY